MKSTTQYVYCISSGLSWKSLAPWLPVSKIQNYFSTNYQAYVDSLGRKTEIETEDFYLRNVSEYEVYAALSHWRRRRLHPDLWVDS